MIKYFDSDSIDPYCDHPATTLLRGSNGARMGVSLVAYEEYGKTEDHDDQEGLFFIEGSGKVMLDGNEYDFNPQTYILMPAHTKHSFKKNPDSCVVKLLWFHSAN